MRIFAAWMLGAMLIAMRVSADDGAPRAQYDALLEDGASEFAAGNWGEARWLFRQAHNQSPNAETSRGLGMCDFELRRYVQAIPELEAALGDSRRALTAELRQQTEHMLQRARRDVGRYRIDAPAGVSALTVDGKR